VISGKLLDSGRDFGLSVLQVCRLNWGLMFREGGCGLTGGDKGRCTGRELERGKFPSGKV